MKKSSGVRVIVGKETGGDDSIKFFLPAWV